LLVDSILLVVVAEVPILLTPQETEVEVVLVAVVMVDTTLTVHQKLMGNQHLKILDLVVAEHHILHLMRQLLDLVVLALFLLHIPLDK